MHTAYLVNIISRLPDSPGIYKYYDKEKNLIYIGKAKSLKKRVSSYFNKQQYENRKTAVMVSKIADIQFTLSGAPSTQVDTYASSFVNVNLGVSYKFGN